jgi:hypothetical protein
MPNQDGSLTAADTLTLVRVLDRMIPVDDPDLAAGALGLLGEVQERAINDAPTGSAFLRIVEALSLDLLAHAVGGFSALTEEEQTSTLRNIENTLPREFSVVLGLVRDVYYEDERTPERPKSFDNDDEIFGKVVVEEEPEQVSKKRR